MRITTAMLQRCLSNLKEATAVLRLSAWQLQQWGLACFPVELGALMAPWAGEWYDCHVDVIIMLTKDGELSGR